MLSRETIESLAAAHSIHPFQEEQRFRLALLLYHLRKYDMVFKGGTMIWFLHGNFRYSRDLDFNLYENSARPSSKDLERTIKRAFGDAGQLKEYRESETFINAEVSFPGITIPLGIKIKIEVTVPWLYIDEPETSFLSFPEYALPSFSQKTLGIESVIADKINGLQKRKDLFNVLKDAFDIWYLAKILHRTTTKKHVDSIFKKTGMTADKEKIFGRLEKSLEFEKRFRQYLLPTAKVEMKEAVKFVKQYVAENL